MEKITKDFVKSDFLKSQNLSFFKSHFRAFGPTIPNYFREKIFFDFSKNIFRNIFSKNIFNKKYFFLNHGTKCSEMAFKKRQILRI